VVGKDLYPALFSSRIFGVLDSLCNVFVRAIHASWSCSKDQYEKQDDKQHEGRDKEPQGRPQARATSLQHLSMRPKLSTPGVPGGVGNAPSGTFPVGDGPIRSGLPPKPRTRPSIVAR
jgi:hypothetical protein